jgi:hypothetical protein
VNIHHSSSKNILSIFFSSIFSCGHRLQYLQRLHTPDLGASYTRLWGLSRFVFAILCLWHLLSFFNFIDLFFLLVFKCLHGWASYPAQAFVACDVLLIFKCLLELLRVSRLETGVPIWLGRASFSFAARAFKRCPNDCVLAGWLTGLPSLDCDSDLDLRSHSNGCFACAHL